MIRWQVVSLKKWKRVGTMDCCVGLGDWEAGNKSKEDGLPVDVVRVHFDRGEVRKMDDFCFVDAWIECFGAGKNPLCKVGE